MATRLSEQQRNWEQKHCIRASVKLHTMHDFELVSWLKKQKNKNEAIKKAIQYYLDHDEGRDDF